MTACLFLPLPALAIGEVEQGGMAIEGGPFFRVLLWEQPDRSPLFEYWQGTRRRSQIEMLSLNRHRRSLLAASRSCCDSHCAAAQLCWVFGKFSGHILQLTARARQW